MDIVFYVVVMKYVFIVEEYVFDGVLMNVYGSMNVVDVCVKCGVLVMVMILMDKVVNFLSMMGVIKCVVELYC